jgi:hypothetical protein
MFVILQLFTNYSLLCLHGKQLLYGICLEKNYTEYPQSDISSGFLKTSCRQHEDDSLTRLQIEGSQLRSEASPDKFSSLTSRCTHMEILFIFHIQRYATYALPTRKLIITVVFCYDTPQFGKSLTTKITLCWVVMSCK